VTTPAAELLTVGHGTLAAEDLAGLLVGAGVVSLVDIRIGPGSRRNPHLGRAELERWLPEAGVAYRWERRLGGFRKPPETSPDVALRNDSFRAYAAHMRTPEFRAALGEVLAEAATRRTAVMCSETVWWRCHRRLVADSAVLLDGVAVTHLMPGGRLADHRPTDGARVAGPVLVYDASGVTVPT
jgi:uncharacterized protein (DUF488 family)